MLSLRPGLSTSHQPSTPAGRSSPPPSLTADVAAPARAFSFLLQPLLCLIINSQRLGLCLWHRSSRKDTQIEWVWGKNHAGAGGWEAEEWRPDFYPPIPHSITFYTRGVGKIRHRPLNCLQDKDEESALLQTFRIESKKVVELSQGAILAERLA